MAQEAGTQRKKRSGNGFDAEVLNDFCGRVLRLQDELASKRGEIMSDIKEVYGEGAEQLGVSRGKLREAVQEKIAEIKKGRKRAKMDAEDRAILEQLMLGLDGFEDTADQAGDE